MRRQYFSKLLTENIIMYLVKIREILIYVEIPGPYPAKTYFITHDIEGSNVYKVRHYQR